MGRHDNTLVSTHRYKLTMLSVGLTGGVGCGKTAVTRLFAGHGVPIVDSDVITRELVAPGSPALTQIAAELGEQVLAPDGQLDRRRLRARVFAEPAAREALEAILHPRVRTEIRARLAALEAPYAIAAVPLLVESRMTDTVERVLVVDCDEQRQVERVMARDACSEQDVRAIMATQATRAARLAAADEVLSNDGARAALDAQVARLHARYLALAGH